MSDLVGHSLLKKPIDNSLSLWESVGMFGPKPGNEVGGGWDGDTRKAYEDATRPVNETGRENNKKYRIAWKGANGNSGHGEYIFDEKDANEVARSMNEKHKGRINHWVEREP